MFTLLNISSWISIMLSNRFFIFAFLFASTFAGADIHIDESIPYRDKEEIDNRIVSECSEIGSIMSESLRENAAKSGITVVRDGLKQDTYADIAITSAMSAGNAFIGHAKGMAVSVTLYIDGKQINKTKFSRNSMGGMFGGFKGSCSVLNRTAKVLGMDIAKWVIQEQKTAQAK